MPSRSAQDCGHCASCEVRDAADGAQSARSPPTSNPRSPPSTVQKVDEVVDEKLTVGGETFECKKLTFVSDGASRKWTVWLSPKVKAYGVVAVKLVKRQRVTETTLVGYGTKEKTLWGKTAAETKAKPDEGR